MRVGYANMVTGGRLVLVASVASLISQPEVPPVAWTAVVVSTIAALLDIADGWVARRTGTATAFGARFDMEVDALLVLVLSLLAWRWDKAGAWVLLSGLLRYGFVAGGWLLPWLRNPLPPSRRRKTVCVVQIVALIVVLGPIITPPLSTFIAAAGLLILGYSFLVDSVWLWTSSEAPPHTDEWIGGSSLLDARPLKGPRLRQLLRQLLRRTIRNLLHLSPFRP